MNHLKKKDMKQIRKLFCLHSTEQKKETGLLHRVPNKFCYFISNDHQECHQTKTYDNKCVCLCVRETQKKEDKW